MYVARAKHGIEPSTIFFSRVRQRIPSRPNRRGRRRGKGRKGKRTGPAEVLLRYTELMVLAMRLRVQTLDVGFEVFAEAVDPSTRRTDPVGAAGTVVP